MNKTLPFQLLASVCCCLLLAFSCGNSPSKVKGTNEVQSDDLMKLNKETIAPLRTDSVLQFSVMVTSIFEDSKGNLCFGSHGDGLCKYDGEQFIYLTAGNGLPMGTDREFAPGLDWDDVRTINSGNQAGGVQEDKDGNIWCESGGEICKFNGKEFEPVSISEVVDLPKGGDWKAILEHVWFGWSDGIGICYHDGKELKCFRFPVKDERGFDRISSRYLDSSGTLWFGTMDNGTFTYDGEICKPVLSKLDAGISRSIFEDASRRIWLPQNGEGKDMFYSENGEIHNFTLEYKEKFPETDEGDLLTGAQCAAQAANGDIWFGTFGAGLYKYDGEAVELIMPNQDESLSLSKSIYKTKSGKLLFGLGEGSVYELVDGEFIRFDGL